jgi:hypothetical protein
MDKEKLQVWALTAEIISGVAVVATLLFLAFEMRDNTNAAQAQTYQILMQEINGYRKMIGEQAMAEVVVKYGAEGWDALNPVEQRQIRSTQLVIWGIYESAYFANKRGILGASEWSRFNRLLCDRLDNSKAQWASGHQTPIRELHTAEFVEYVEKLCQ